MSSSTHMWLCALAFALPAVAMDERDTCQDRATQILQALDAGEFDDARQHFDQRMRPGLSRDALRSVWNALPGQVGARLQVAPVRGSATSSGQSAVIPMQHERAWLELQVQCDPQSRVSGLWIRPGKAPEVAADSSTLADSPDYVRPERFVERELLLASAGLELPATLALPIGDGPHPAVVLVHGSGAHDRDSSIGQHKPLRDLAQGLASHGIASLRYDKRSHVAAESFAGKAFTVQEEVVDDAVAAIAILRSTTGVDPDRVYIAGHSLGAMLAPRIATAAPQARGMILLAAPGRALIDIIPFQLRYLAELDGSITPEEHAQLDAADALHRRISALTPADAADHTPLLGAPAAYWLDLASYDPIASALALAKPTLLLQGEGDYQVTVAEDYQRWHGALADHDWFQGQLFAGIGHLYTPAGTPPSPQDYAQAGHVDGRVIKAIVEWIDH